MAELLDIFGQDAALTQLIRSVEGSRRPHAFIFAGPEGIGKRTTAEAFAALLLCRNPQHVPNAARLPQLPPSFSLPKACGQCESCRAIAAGTHPDYNLVSKESARYSSDTAARKRVMQDLGIDVVREFIIGPSSRRSAMGKGKVFVVREADLMSVAAQNALLKTLEEPPPGVTLILLCTTPTALLPTTRSRCALVRFAPLDVSLVAQKLAQTGIEAPVAHFLAACTGGSLGVSLRWAKQGIYERKRELVMRLANLVESVDAELGEWFIAQTDALKDQIIAADAQLAGSLASRLSAGLWLGLIASVYRDAMAYSAGRTEALVHADQSDAIAAIAAAMGAERSAEIVVQLARYEELLWSNVNPKPVWDNVVITCATGAPLHV